MKMKALGLLVLLFAQNALAEESRVWFGNLRAAAKNVLVESGKSAKAGIRELVASKEEKQVAELAKSYGVELGATEKEYLIGALEKDLINLTGYFKARSIVTRTFDSKTGASVRQKTNHLQAARVARAMKLGDIDFEVYKKLREEKDELPDSALSQAKELETAGLTERGLNEYFSMRDELHTQDAHFVILDAMDMEARFGIKTMDYLSLRRFLKYDHSTAVRTLMAFKAAEFHDIPCFVARVSFKKTVEQAINECAMRSAQEAIARLKPRKAFGESREELSESVSNRTTPKTIESEAVNPDPAASTQGHISTALGAK